VSRPTRLVVFDLDGTLIDSIGDIAASANQALVEFFGPRAHLRPDRVRQFVGGGARQLIERCLAEIGQPAARTIEVFDRFLAVYRGRLTETTVLYDGMAEALECLGASARLAVLTNKPGDMSRAIIRDLGLEARFMANVGGDDLETRKPDPEGLLAIVARAGAAIGETMMVGDSAIDIETAHNAGAVAVGVTWGYDPAGMESARPGRIVDAPRQLMDIVIER
jgi:phosphoglycolate phosphatase